MLHQLHQDDTQLFQYANLLPYQIALPSTEFVCNGPDGIHHNDNSAKCDACGTEFCSICVNTYKWCPWCSVDDDWNAPRTVGEFIDPSSDVKTTTHTVRDSFGGGHDSDVSVVVYTTSEDSRVMTIVDSYTEKAHIEEVKTPMPCHYGSVAHGAKKGKPLDIEYFFVQEKIDGSQFSTWVHPDKDGTPLQFFCGTKKIGKGANMFNKAMEMMLSIHSTLQPGWTYHAECVQKLKQNVIVYERMPAMFNIVYDIQDENRRWLRPYECEEECKRVGLEYVGCMRILSELSTDPREYAADMKLERSILGDDVVPEGIVVKCMQKNGTYSRWKYVRAEFKEMQKKKKPKAQAITPTVFCAWVGSLFSTSARMAKAIQHLRQRGIDTNDANIEREIDSDLLKERSRLIYRYLETEFTPIVTCSNQTRRREQDRSWADDPIFKSLRAIDPKADNIGDQIYASCLLVVLYHSAKVKVVLD
jgi:hypothetical protein